MYDEDLFFNIDGDMGPNNFRDEGIEQFYNKLGEYNSSWVDLEGLSYKNSKIGRLNFAK